MNTFCKAFGSILLSVGSVTFAVSGDQEQSSENVRFEKTTFKILSEKKQRKLLDKAKKNLSQEKLDEMVNQVIYSSLTDSQKAGVVEALDKAKDLLEK